MKRNYNQEAVKKALQMIAQRIPGSFVGMDVIAGFPTKKSEARFQEGFEVLRGICLGINCMCSLTATDSRA